MYKRILRGLIAPFAIALAGIPLLGASGPRAFAAFDVYQVAAEWMFRDDGTTAVSFVQPDVDHTAAEERQLEAQTASMAYQTFVAVLDPEAAKYYDKSTASSWAEALNEQILRRAGSPEGNEPYVVLVVAGRHPSIVVYGPFTEEFLKKLGAMTKKLVGATNATTRSVELASKWLTGADELMSDGKVLRAPTPVETPIATATPSETPPYRPPTMTAPTVAATPSETQPDHQETSWGSIAAAVAAGIVIGFLVSQLARRKSK